MRAADGGAFPVRIRRIDDPEAVRQEAEGRFGAPTAVWRHGAAALSGWGAARRLVLGGPGRLTAAADAWRALVASAEVEGDGALPGPIAFGAFAFADDSAAESALLVPRVALVERDGVAVRIDAGGDGAAAPRRVLAGPDGAACPPERYEAAVAAAVARIRSSELEKAVLARDLPVDAPGLDLPAVLRRLAERYDGSWVFSIDGVFGASPETLIAVRDGAATSRVLAGTAPRSDDPAQDAAARDALLASPKNRFEHALAVDSLLIALGDAVDDLVIGRPFALRLPNVWHLATDGTARVHPGLGALDLVALLHPTAAVAGSPRRVALRLIAELEPFDRRRYAGPVGWIDARGDGEWAIALRSAEVEGPDRVRAYAGAGIVADSDPAQELEETGWKLQPVLDALAPQPATR